MDDQKLNAGRKLWGVIVSPAPTFRLIGEDPRILAPALLVIAVDVLLAWLIIPETLAYTKSVLESTGETLTADMLNATLTWTKVSVIAGAAFLPPLIWLVQAVLLWLVKQFTVGEATFKQLYAVSFFAWIPPFLGSAIKSVLVKIGGIDLMMSIKTSLALFLPPSIESGFWFLMLSKMDFFTIWGLVLLALGGAVVMKKEFKNTAPYIFGIWLVYIVIVAYLSSKFGNLAGM
ncbi:MAG: hypothetical protein GXY92_01840 [Syntrophomonadaceae bacterium]|nr:hypothetical protein [Syntrophomonadaceae bacterium]